MTSPFQDRAGGEVRLYDRPNILVKQLSYAKQLQRQGLTFTEIADDLRVNRQSVVDALYWSVVR